jgi:hypothetical protein
MESNKRNDDEADRFLREGLREFVPAVRALSSFIHEIEGRVRKVLEPHNRELGQLSVASSTSKLSFGPTIGGGQPEQVIQVGVKDPDRSGFYIRINPDQTQSRSLYVGFWLWTPAPQDRQELFRMLRPLWDSDGYRTEQGEYQTLYVGRYADQGEYFPAFETALDELVQHVIAGLTKIDFAGRFGPGFRKVRAQVSRAKALSPAE